MSTNLSDQIALINKNLQNTENHTDKLQSRILSLYDEIDQAKTTGNEIDERRLRDELTIQLDILRQNESNKTILFEDRKRLNEQLEKDLDHLMDEGNVIANL